MSRSQAGEAAARVTSKHRDTFVADGVVKIAGAVDEEWIGRVLAVADQQLRDPGKWVSDTNPGAPENRLFTSRYRWEIDPVIGDFVHNSGMAQMAAALMDSKTARFYLGVIGLFPHSCNTPSPPLGAWAKHRARIGARE